MARFDKYDPISGGFRAPLAAAFTGGASGVDFGKVFAVGLTAGGLLTMTAPASGYLGAMILTEAKSAGAVVDTMTAGEIVEFDLNWNGTTGAATAGTTYYASGTAGQFNATAVATGVNALRLGTTVEASRLIVRAAVFQGP